MIWEIQLTQIATAFGDENLASDGAARTPDRSSRSNETGGAG
jgi:hypothetical protein